MELVDEKSEASRPTRSVGQRSLRLLVGVPLLALALAVMFATLIVIFRLLV